MLFSPNYLFTFTYADADVLFIYFINNNIKLGHTLSLRVYFSVFISQPHHCHLNAPNLTDEDEVLRRSVDINVNM